MQRRARTRRLIELGGLVAKSGLEQALAAHEPDASAALLGALLELAEDLQGPATDAAVRARVAAWCARGRRALRTPDADAPA